MKSRLVFRALAAIALTTLVAGCAAYSWRTRVPPECRTAVVPTFRNATDVTEFGAVVARQVARELQREGSYRIASAEDAALEIQGELVSVALPVNARDRRTGARFRENRLEVVARVSFIDRRGGRVLVDGRTYTADALFAGGDDVATLARDASGRAADELARQIVDDARALKW